MGNAADWAATVRRTLGATHVNSTPAVGAIAWWDGSGVLSGGGSGHVAYVEKVAGSTIYLSDSSFPIASNPRVGGSSLWTVTRGSTRWPDGFLHIKDAPTVRAGASPVGHLDSASGLTGDRVHVAGWTFDPDAPTAPVRVHVWIDGKPGTAGATEIDLGWATATRNDVARVHRSAGAKHGFSRAIPGVPPGSHAIRVYALNRARGGSTTYLGGRTVSVPSTPGEIPAPSPEAGHSWFLTNALDGSRDVDVIGYGRGDDRPLTGDWNGDGTDTIGVFRPSDSHWYLTNALGNPRDLPDFGYGRPDDIQLTGDWNGDGKDTVGVFRPSDGRWYLTNTLDGSRDLPDFGYGRPDDIQLTGDWNGDGRDTIGVRR